MKRIAISNSHRLGPRPRPGTRDPPRDIIVKFVRYRDRALVYSNKRNLKSYNQNTSNNYKIFINEALTTKRAKLYAKLRRCRRDRLIQSCWTYEGNIFVKKTEQSRKIRIQSDSDITEIINRIPPHESTHFDTSANEKLETSTPVVV